MADFLIKSTSQGLGSYSVIVPTSDNGRSACLMLGWGVVTPSDPVFILTEQKKLKVTQDIEALNCSVIASRAELKRGSCW